MDDQTFEDYRILEIKPGATLEELKHAYHELMKVWHPDRFEHDSGLMRKALEKTTQINLAYERLKVVLNSGAGPTSHASQEKDPNYARANELYERGVNL